MNSAVTRSADTVAGVPGIRFTTAARPDSPEERVLQQIQATLSGGVVDLPDSPTVAHLAFQYVRVLDADPYSVITLWVPAAQESEAAAALRAEGFKVE